MVLLFCCALVPVSLQCLLGKPVLIGRQRLVPPQQAVGPGPSLDLRSSSTPAGLPQPLALCGGSSMISEVCIGLVVSDHLDGKDLMSTTMCLEKPSSPVCCHISCVLKGPQVPLGEGGC
jgi:hypothetical protein